LRRRRRRARALAPAFKTPNPSHASACGADGRAPGRRWPTR
jgi:hypothetical protein